MEKRSQWKFNPSDDGWVWTVANPDGSNQQSAQVWPTLKDCVDDATRHGYVAWKAEEERRRDQKLGVTDVLKRSGN